MADQSSQIGPWLTVSADKGENGVKHQCKANFADGALDAGADYARTGTFQWPVMGDFSVFYECKDSSGDGANLVLDGTNSGSVDGTNYVDMHTDNSILREGKAAGVFVYDMDSNGVAPFMRIEVTADDALDGAQSIWITVVPHIVS